MAGGGINIDEWVSKYHLVQTEMKQINHIYSNLVFGAGGTNIRTYILSTSLSTRLHGRQSY